MRQKSRAAHRAAPFLLCSSLLGAAAWAAEPRPAAQAPAASAADGSVDVLRQRLADRLGNKGDGPMRVIGRGRGEDAKSGGKGAPRPASPAAAPKAEPAVRWGYTGDGAPEHWATLSPDNRICGTGTRQSPIDIRDTIRVDLEPIRFDYRPGGFAVLDNGRAIEVRLEPGNALQILGRRYELKSVQFHRPGETRVNGRQYEMDAYLVHQDAEGRFAYVAVLFERGGDQPLVQTVLNHLPLEKGDALPAPVPLDLNRLLPEDRAYFTYMGSLTTPPCTEGVLWMVMRQPVPLSAQQLAIFSRLYPMNARPVQAGSGRLIKESQ